MLRRRGVEELDTRKANLLIGGFDQQYQQFYLHYFMNFPFTGGLVPPGISSNYKAPSAFNQIVHLTFHNELL